MEAQRGPGRAKSHSRRCGRKPRAGVGSTREVLSTISWVNVSQKHQAQNMHVLYGNMFGCFNVNIIYVVPGSSKKKKLSIKAEIEASFLGASITRKPKPVRKLVMIWNVDIKMP